jgi:purine nucleosidase
MVWGAYGANGAGKASGRSGRIPLVLDTDIGDDVDDVFALLLAAGEPSLDLLGVTTVFGDVQTRARITRKVLDAAGGHAVPVLVGHGDTLTGRPVAPGAPGNRMTSAMGYLEGPDSAEWRRLGERLDRRDAVDFILEAAASRPGEVVLAAIGPLTNVAAAIRRAPEVARQLRGIVIMGGRLDPDPAIASREHNFHCDWEAARTVLESGLPLRIGNFNVTSQAKLGAEHLPRLRAGNGACRDAADQLEVYLRARDRGETPMFDGLALTLAYTDRYLTTRPMALRLRENERFTYLDVEEGAPPNAHVSVDFDGPAFTEHMLVRMGC